MVRECVRGVIAPYAQLKFLVLVVCLWPGGWDVCEFSHTACTRPSFLMRKKQASDSDKSAGVVALTMVDLRR